MSGLRALWLVRRNLVEHHGGDTMQIQQTAAALHRSGVNVELGHELPGNPRGFDLVHLFHLDRLWENLAHARRARAAGLPVVLSTIYWPTDEFDRGGRAGVQGWLARLLGSATYQNLRMLQRHLLHAVERRCWPEWQAALSFRSGVVELLHHAAVLLPNSVAEREVLAQRFGARRPTVVVPNAADAALFGPPPAPAPQRSGVLCIGRIEPRKNQLALIEALRGAGLPLTIVGEPGRFSRKYYERCRAAADAWTASVTGHPPVRFLPGRPAAALPALCHAAQVHACVSWYETPGLVSLEAALCGCAIVATPGGCTREYLGDDACYADPGSTSSIRAAVLQAFARGPAAQLAQRIRTAFTWEAAAGRTLEGYNLAMSRPVAG